MQNTIEVNGVSYTKTDSIETKPTKKQILVLQRGWVIVGDVSQESSMVSVSNCSVVRVWGTSNGLGELAENGPLSETVLDPCPPVQAHELSIVLRMNANESNW